MSGKQDTPTPHRATGHALSNVIRAASSLALLTVMLISLTSCGPSTEDRAFSRLEPELLSPADGTAFDRGNPRGLMLTWKKVPGADRYMVEVEMQNPIDGVWMPAPVFLHRRFVDTERISINFPGSQPGRWRIVAINESDAKTRPSEWWRFEFLQ